MLCNCFSPHVHNFNDANEALPGGQSSSNSGNTFGWSFSITRIRQTRSAIITTPPRRPPPRSTSTSRCIRNSQSSRTEIDRRVPRRPPYNVQPSAAVHDAHILVIHATASLTAVSRRTAQQLDIRDSLEGGTPLHTCSRLQTTLDNRHTASDSSPAPGRLHFRILHPPSSDDHSRQTTRHRKLIFGT